MNGRQIELACIGGAITNRYRLMTEAIERGDSDEAGEHAKWLAFLGIELLAEKSGVLGFQIYIEVHNWWDGGQ